MVDCHGSFAIRVRPKPGSLTADGRLVGIFPVRNPKQEPVVVPANYGVSLRRLLGRCRAMEAAGYVMCPAALMPKIPNRDEAVLIHRDSERYQLFLSTPAHRRQHGAASTWPR